MAADLLIDPELLQRALDVSGAETMAAAVTLALREFIARREQAGRSRSVRILGVG